MIHSKDVGLHITVPSLDCGNMSCHLYTARSICLFKFIIKGPAFTSCFFPFGFMCYLPCLSVGFLVLKLCSCCWIHSKS